MIEQLEPDYKIAATNRHSDEPLGKAEKQKTHLYKGFPWGEYQLADLLGCNVDQLDEVLAKAKSGELLQMEERREARLRRLENTPEGTKTAKEVLRPANNETGDPSTFTRAGQMYDRKGITKKCIKAGITYCTFTRRYEMGTPYKDCFLSNREWKLTRTCYIVRDDHGIKHECCSLIEVCAITGGVVGPLHTALGKAVDGSAKYRGYRIKILRRAGKTCRK